MSHQPLSGDHFKSRYDKNVFWAQNAQISLFGPRSPTNLKFWFFFTFTRSDLIIRFQRAINYYLEIILTQDNTKTCFGPKMTKYGYSTPAAAHKLQILTFFTFTRSDLIIRLQWAISHYLEITFSLGMSKNVFWAQNAQIWLFGPRPPQNWKFWYFSLSLYAI